MVLNIGRRFLELSILWDFSWQIRVACLAEVFIASTLREIFYVRKSITYITHGLFMRELIHVRTPFDVVFSCETNVTRSGLARIISEIAKHPFELSLDQMRNLRSDSMPICLS